MPGVQLSNPRKRRVSEPPSPHQSLYSQHPTKKQKCSHENELKLPTAFWDNLSKIYLNKAALREHVQRYNRANPKQSQDSPRSDSRIPAVEYLDRSGPRTLKSIKQTAKHGGPDLSDIRGLKQPQHPLDPRMRSSRSNSRVPRRSSSSVSNSKSSSRTTKSTGPYDPNFQQKLIDGGIYPSEYRYPNGQATKRPKNWEEIQERLRLRRPSLSPSRFSRKSYEKFVQADADAAKEKQVTTSVIPVIEGDIGDAKCVSGGIPFTNLQPLIDGTLRPGNPDIYYGTRPEELYRQVRDDLGGHIIPSKQDNLPILPNFLVAAKGPDGSAAVAKRQASYDAALGARSMHTIQFYGEEPLYDHKAYTISSTYHDGQLKMYTCHVAQPSIPLGKPEYILTQIKAWSMTGDEEIFRQGATAYRNARDWAKEQRDRAIRAANQKAARQGAKVSATVVSLEASASEPTVENDKSFGRESHSKRERASNSTTKRDSCTPSPKPPLDTQTTKRPSEQMKRQSPLQRKRHNPSVGVHSAIDTVEASIEEAWEARESGLSQSIQEYDIGQSFTEQEFVQEASEGYSSDEQRTTPDTSVSHPARDREMQQPKG